MCLILEILRYILFIHLSIHFCPMRHCLHSPGMVPDSKVHGANMGPIWGRLDPGGPHVGPMNLLFGVLSTDDQYSCKLKTKCLSKFINLKKYICYRMVQYDSFMDMVSRIPYVSTLYFSFRRKWLLFISIIAFHHSTDDLFTVSYRWVCH